MKRNDKLEKENSELKIERDELKVYKEKLIQAQILGHLNKKVQLILLIIYTKKDIEFLFESGIYDDISRITVRDLVLVMINYLKALKGKSG